MFDAILYINLEYRTDRKNSILNEIKKIKHFHECHVHRIDAVLDTLCGHIGCGKSHIKALELAICNNWSSVLILEDDFVFTEHYKDASFEKIKNIKFDVMLLAKGYDCNQVSSYNFLKKAIRSTTTSGYIIKRHYYHVLLENFKNSVITMENELKIHYDTCISQNKPFIKLNECSAIDLSWFSLQEKDTFYMYDPPIGRQKDFWSDNNNSLEYQLDKIKSSTNHNVSIIPNIIMYGPWIVNSKYVACIKYLGTGEKVYIIVDDIYTKMVSASGVAKYYNGTIVDFKPENWNEYSNVGNNYRIKFV